MRLESGRFQDFVTAVRHRLNRQRWWTRLAWSGALAGGVLFIVGVVYLSAGYRVPTAWYSIVLGTAALATVVGGVLGRVSRTDAARFADEFFDLSDSAQSKNRFLAEGRKGGLYDLQYRKTDDAIDSADVSRIGIAPRRRLWLSATVLLLASVSLGFKADSAEVQEERAERTLTHQKTEEIKEHLAEEITREEENASEDETRLLEPDKLRKWVQELRATEVREEALKQYARLEKKLDQKSTKLQTKKDERLLAKVAEELEKAPETRPLAKQLKDRKYKKVARKLEDYRQDATKPLSEQKKELARLRSLARRMAHAARNASPGGVSKKQQLQKKRRNPEQGNAQSPTPANAKSKSGSPSTRSGSRSSGSGSQANGTLSEALETLERASQELEEALSEASENESDDSLSKCKGSCNAVNDQLSKLSQRLRGLSARKNANRRVSKLRQALGSCSSYLCNSQGDSLSQCLGNKKGGLKAGSGGSLNLREANEELTDNGQTSQLKGIKGSGPSNASVETADDGSGVSSRAAASRERTFRRQVEAFVEREDVPEDVKDGVKNYFESIHQTD